MFYFNESILFSLQYKGTGNGFWLKMHFQRKKEETVEIIDAHSWKSREGGLFWSRSMVFLDKISRAVNYFRLIIFLSTSFINSPVGPGVDLLPYPLYRSPLPPSPVCIYCWDHSAVSPDFPMAERELTAKKRKLHFKLLWIQKQKQYRNRSNTETEAIQKQKQLSASKTETKKEKRTDSIT